MGSPAGFRLRIAGRTPPVGVTVVFGGSVCLGKRGSLRGSVGSRLSGAPRCSASCPAICPATMTVSTAAVRNIVRKDIVESSLGCFLLLRPLRGQVQQRPWSPEKFTALEEAEDNWAVDDESP